MSDGAHDLVVALQELRDRFDLDCVRATKEIDPGHSIALEITASGPVVIECSHGHSMIVEVPEDVR